MSARLAPCPNNATATSSGALATRSFVSLSSNPLPGDHFIPLAFAILAIIIALWAPLYTVPSPVPLNANFIASGLPNIKSVCT